MKMTKCYAQDEHTTKHMNMVAPLNPALTTLLWQNT